jgi:hypothetical protein
MPTAFQLAEEAVFAMNSSLTSLTKEMRWRFRACSYLFGVGAVWIFCGTLVNVLFHLLADRRTQEESLPIWFTLSMVGFGITSAGFALSLAIWRCPVCDRFLRRTDRYSCGKCGATIRERGESAAS